MPKQNSFIASSPVEGQRLVGYRFHMFRAILLATTLLLAPFSTRAVETYEGCLQLIEADPPVGLTEALQWRDLGGGSPARHCVALAHAANGDLRLAASRLEELAAEIEPSSEQAAAQVLAQAADVWLQAREDGKAVEAFTRAVVLRPDDARLHLDLAHVLASQDRLDDAETEVAAALRLDDLSADAYALKAMLHRERSQFDAADEALANALAIDPGQPMGRMEQALARARGGDIQGAQDDLNDLIAEDPDGNVAETARRYLQRLEIK
jgi:predicted Zn-dependent protease